MATAAMAQATAARRPHSGKSGASRYGAMLAVLDVADEHEKDNVAPEEVVRKGEVEKLVSIHNHARRGQEWISRHVVLTPTKILFYHAMGGPVREEVKLLDIETVEELQPFDEIAPSGGAQTAAVKKLKKAGGSALKLEDDDSHTRSFRIFVAIYNRNFSLRVASTELRNDWISDIKDAKRQAESRAEKEANATILQRWRLHVRKFVEEPNLQMFIGSVLIINFGLNIAEAELQPDPTSTLAGTLDLVDLGFTCFYLIELMLNMFAHWFWDFVCNGWSMFDAICVLSSVASAVYSKVAGTASGGGLSIVRSIRIFKIIRLFARLQSLQRVVLAISRTILPLFNTFIIYMVVNSIYSVLGTQLYGEILPELFGMFSTTFLTLVQTSTGDGWATDVMRPLLETGSASGESFNFHIAVFFFLTYILIVYVVLLNVAVAVLLEGFLSAIADFDAEKAKEESMLDFNKISNNLDPLLATFARFHSEEHLGHMIGRFFQYLDVDGNGFLDFQELKTGLEKLDIEPRVQLSYDDYMSFTQDFTYATEDGEISAENFEACVRLELKGYAFRIAAHQMNEAVKAQSDSASNDYLALKIVMREVFDVSQTLMHRTANEDRSLPGFQRHRREKGSSETDSIPDSEYQASEPARASSIDAKIDKMMNLLLDNKREVASIHSKLESLQDDVSNVYQQLEQGWGGRQQTETSISRQMSSRQPEEQERPAQLSRQKSGQRRRSQQDSHRDMGASIPSVLKIQDSHRAVENSIHSVLKIWVRSAEHVPQMDRMGAADPYLKLELDDQEFTTRTMKNTLRPTWNERFELLVDRHSTELTITVMDWERFGSDRHVGTAKVTVQELIDKAGKDVSINVLRPASTKLLLGKDAEPCILNLFWEFLSGPLQQDVRTVDGRQEEDDERRETNGATTWLRSNGDERTRGSEWNGRGENGERRNRGHAEEGRKGRGRGKENGKGRSPEPRQISVESDFVYHDVDRMETVGTSSNFRNRPSSNPVELRSPRERTARVLETKPGNGRTMSMSNGNHVEGRRNSGERPARIPETGGKQQELFELRGQRLSRQRTG